LKTPTNNKTAVTYIAVETLHGHTLHQYIRKQANSLRYQSSTKPDDKDNKWHCFPQWKL